MATAKFHIGQIVEVDTTGFFPGARLQMGDRGTVIRGSHLNHWGEMQSKVLWHKHGFESHMMDARLRIYVNPMDAPGRAKGSLQTSEALRIVLQEEQPHAIEELMRELERARMEREDFAQGNASAPAWSGNFAYTWRTSNQERDRRIGLMNQTLENIADVVTWHDHGQSSEGNPRSDEDCFVQIREHVQAHGFLVEDSDTEE